MKVRYLLIIKRLRENISKHQNEIVNCFVLLVLVVSDKWAELFERVQGCLRPPSLPLTLRPSSRLVERQAGAEGGERR